MSFLKQILEKECPRLHEALEGSRKAAQEGWLSSIAPSAGSYNSAPHFRNIEGHLDRLLVPVGANCTSRDLAVPLSSLELYLLLASVFFHDLGRVRGDTDHAYASRELLHDKHSELGIPNLELAFSLGRIAIYHDPIRKLNTNDAHGSDQLKKARQDLTELAIEPFGNARELYVGTLISLADHLDGSFRRAEPTFVRPDSEVPIKGAFRRMVLGSAYDSATRCIRTCIHNPWDIDPAHPPREVEAFELSVKSGEHWSTPSASPDMNAKCETEFLLHAKLGLGKVPRRLFVEARDGNWRLARKGDMRSQWPADYCLAIILNDLRHNQAFLAQVQDVLAEMGLPVDDWWVEFKGMLYDQNGNQAEERIFSSEFKHRVAGGMKDLSSLLFARESFSYATLSDWLREPDVDLVRLAVVRLKGKETTFFEKANVEIQTFPNSWKLNQKSV